MGHRPMYCSDYDNDDCTLYNSVVGEKKNKTKKSMAHFWQLIILF